jgi:SAM-dependent methyltransferase
MNCRILNTKLSKFLDLGQQPLGNGFLTEDDFKNEYFYNLSVGFSEESLMCQIIDQPAPEKMFNDNYAFFSHTSSFMQEHFKKLAEKIIKKYFFSKNPFIIELGSNDGILLKNFKDLNINHLGIEPSKNVYDFSLQQGINSINEFFTFELASKILDDYPKADVITASNVLCHIPNLLDVIKGFEKILHENGVIIFEDPYLGDIFKKVSYDQIYDEHVYLFSAHSVINTFKHFGYNLIDIEKIETHGGSMRYYLSKKKVSSENENKISAVLNEEIKLGLTTHEGMANFSNKVIKSKKDLLNLLNVFYEKDIKVAGYAATSKSTTILNYCDIGPELIECIYDTTPLKIGKYSPGKHIPIVNYKDLSLNSYNTFFLFAWNHINEIMAKEKDSTNSYKWITHIPEVRII